MGCRLIFSVQLLLVLQTFFLFEVKTDEVSDLLDDCVDENCAVINVSYGDTNVSPGAHLSAASTLLAPSVSWTPNPFYKYYTLFLLDPDSLTTAVPGASDTQFNHWCITNIVGNDVTSGTVLAEYLPPLPPPGMERHNYIFLLYNHYYEKDCGSFDRSLFDMEKYAEECQLGIPVAFNYFEVGKNLDDIESDVSSVL